jgi:DNA-3-methyladenine glycosylase
MHFCANVVTGEEESGEAVLIRALEPLEGNEMMMKNRFGSRPGRATDGLSQQNLANGPAKLCEALSIRREQNGTDLLGDEIYLLDAPRLTAAGVKRSTRIGITSGKDKKWRFTIKASPWVSR